MEIADVDLEKAALGGEPAERAARVDEGGETDTDIDRMALLGGEPAERASGVDKGDGTERKDLWLPKAELYCEDKHQHNENASENLPSAYKLPLEGEWTGYASGEASDPKGNENTSNAAIEHADGSREQCRLADVVVSIKSEGPDGGGIPCVRLGCTSWRAGDANGPGNRAERSTGKTDESRVQTDAPNASNRPEMAGMSCGEGAGTYPGAGDAKHAVDATDGVGSHADTSSEHADVPNVQTDANRPVNESKNVRMLRKRKKPPDSPVETARRRSDERNGVGDRTDTSSVRMDAHCVGNDMETAENDTKIVRTCQNGSKMKNSPSGREIATPERSCQWKQVIVENVDVYLPWNAPVEALG